MAKKNEFTDKEIKALKPQEKSYIISEHGGLYVRVSPKGKKTWYHIVTFDGGRKWYKLGTYPSTSLLEAREKLREARKYLENDKCPVAEKRKEKKLQEAAPTIRDLGKEYLQEHAKIKKKSWAEDERILEVDVYPVLGDRKAHEIDQRDVVKFLDEIASRTKVHANRVLALVRKMFNVGIARGLVKSNPCLYVPQPQEEEARTRHLSDHEVKDFWNKLDRAPFEESTIRALKMLLVTAQRPGEVAGMHWSEIEGRWWIIPPERLKSGKRKNVHLPHRVYLSDLALEILGPKGTGFVFPSERHKGEKSISNNTLPHALKKRWKTLGLKAHCTAHDLRRTATTHMTKNGIPRFTISKILNHAEGGVTSLYDLYMYDKEKSDALRLWGIKLKNIVSAGEEALSAKLNPALKPHPAKLSATEVSGVLSDKSREI